MEAIQPPLPGLDAALIGLGALAAVAPTGIWQFTKHFFSVMPHEGAHGLIGIRYAPEEGKVVAAYAIAWLLMLSGVRQVIDHGVGAADAGILADMTGLPRVVWTCVWLAGTLAALAFGGKLLVMRV